jgi:hypothetical protein
MLLLSKNDLNILKQFEYPKKIVAEVGNGERLLSGGHWCNDGGSSGGSAFSAEHYFVTGSSAAFSVEHYFVTG